MAKKRSEPDWYPEWLEMRRELEELWKRREQRFAAADAREALRRACLRRLTFGLFGRA